MDALLLNNKLTTILNLSSSFNIFLRGITIILLNCSKQHINHIVMVCFRTNQQEKHELHMQNISLTWQDTFVHGLFYEKKRRLSYQSNRNDIFKPRKLVCICTKTLCLVFGFLIGESRNSETSRCQPQAFGCQPSTQLFMIYDGLSYSKPKKNFVHTNLQGY